MKGKRRKPTDAPGAPPSRRTPRRGAVSDVAGTFPVVAIGASAGGLDALRKFFDVTPPDSDMAFVVIQHLDPTHPSMMVELLAGRTAMRVQQAIDRKSTRLNSSH